MWNAAAVILLIYFVLLLLSATFSGWIHLLPVAAIIMMVVAVSQRVRQGRSTPL